MKKISNEEGIVNTNLELGKVYLDDFEPRNLKISPFNDISAEINKSIIKSFNGEPTKVDNFIFTNSGREALSLALSTYNLKSNDVVSIITTTQNYYVSSCVTNVVSKYCNWDRAISNKTNLILVINEFGFPLKNNIKEIINSGLPIIEDSVYNFPLDYLGNEISIHADFIVHSLSKVFPIKSGGILINNCEFNFKYSGIETESSRELKILYDYYSKKIELIRSKKIFLYKTVESLLQKNGARSRFQINAFALPGVYLFSLDKEIELEILKSNLVSMGIECSVFYGENVFFLPINHNMTKQDISFMIDLFDHYLSRLISNNSLNYNATNGSISHLISRQFPFNNNKFHSYHSRLVDSVINYKDFLNQTNFYIAIKEGNSFNSYYTPFSFSNILLFKKKLLYPTLNQIVSDLVNKNVKSLELTLPPQILINNYENMIQNLIDYGFIVKYTDQTSIIPLNEYENFNEYFNLLKKSVKYDFKRAQKSSLEFTIINKDQASKLYQTILKNKVQNNYGITLSGSHFEDIIKESLLDFDSFAIMHNNIIIAGAFCVRYDDVAFLVTWGDDIKYRKYTPMTYLAIKIIEYYFDRVSYWDLGVSSTKGGEAKNSLLQFKSKFLSHNFIKHTLEIDFTKEIDND
jgi:hypothetical protein